MKVETYLKRTGMTASRFGRDVLGDPGFVFDLRAGREPRPLTTQRVAAYLDRSETAPCSR